MSPEKAKLIAKRTEEMINARLLNWDMLNETSEEYFEKKRKGMRVARINLEVALSMEV